MRRCLLLIGLLLLGAGGGSGITITGNQTPVVASVQRNNASLALQTGQTAQLSATVRDANGSTSTSTEN